MIICPFCFSHAIQVLYWVSLICFKMLTNILLLSTMSNWPITIFFEIQLVALNSVWLAKAKEYDLAHHKYKGNYKIILHDRMTQRANVYKRWRSHRETQCDEKLFRYLQNFSLTALTRQYWTLHCVKLLYCSQIVLGLLFFNKMRILTNELH